FSRDWSSDVCSSDLTGQRVGFRLCRVGVHQNVGAASQVVDDHQFIDLQQHDVGGAVFLSGRKRLGRPAEARLDVAHRVVAEVTGEAAGKAWHARAQRYLEAPLIVFNEGERVTLVGFDDLTLVHHFGSRAPRTDHGFGGQADEGVTAGSFAAHDGFQKAAVAPAVRPAVRELQVNRQGGVEGGIRLGDEGYAVVALCGEGVEFNFCHGGL